MSGKKPELKETKFVGDDVSYLYVDGKALKELTFALAQKVINSGENIDQLIILAKGGWVSGRTFFDYLQSVGLNDAVTIGVKSITGINQQKEPVIYQKLPDNLEKELKGKKVLIVEELSDTGKQLQVVSEYLNALGVEKIILASLFRKPHSTAELDHWIEETTSWIIFAYEAIETMGELYVGWTDKKRTEKIEEEEIKQRFIEIGFEEADIEFFWEYKAKIAQRIILKREEEVVQAKQLALQSQTESATV